MITTKKEPLISIRNLKKHFKVKDGFVKKNLIRAVDGVTFDVYKGETLGIVGESGCGKSTLGKTMLRLQEPTEGEILLSGEDIIGFEKKQLKEFRETVQMIFQDPFSSINPRMRIGQTLIEPLNIHGKGKDTEERKEKIEKIIDQVGLNSNFLNRYPHELSGGQSQRVGIARALLLNPDLIVLDEAVSALDVSIQSQIINLLKDLQEEYELTYIFISHDLSVIEHISDRIAVMYLGEIVEITDKNELFSNPKHPYTESLLSAIPLPDPILQRNKERIILKGDVPDPSNPPTGCPFHTRCPYKKDICIQEKPKLRQAKDYLGTHEVACHFSDELELQGIEIEESQ